MQDTVDAGLLCLALSPGNVLVAAGEDSLDDAGGALWSLAGAWILGGQVRLKRRTEEKN